MPTTVMSDSSQASKPILVLGGTGKTGSRVVVRLRSAGVPVRIGSRFGDPPFDWENEQTWRRAVRGVRAAYISYYPDLAMHGAPEAVRAFAETALDSGVRRLVLLSGRGEAEAQRAEAAVRATGADLSIVQCGWFMQNFSENYLLDSVRNGQVVLPAGDQLEPFVDTDDIADVAVAALTNPAHVGEFYELTGPRLLSFPQAVREIAAASGRRIDYVEVPVSEYAAAAADQGVPEEFVRFLTYLFGEVLGRNAYLSDGVERALGRAPRDFADYARRTAARGVWETPVPAA
jgi:uncharacterized protein YbjT (DUF2867 family)